MTHLNPESKVINPELVKAAAEMAIPKTKPGTEWYIYSDGRIISDYGRRVYDVFDPLTSDSDAFKLCDALELHGWQFWYAPGKYCGRLWQTMADMKSKPVYQDKSSPMRYLLCLSAMTGIGVWVGA